jgi:hypothetical protein
MRWCRTARVVPVVLLAAGCATGTLEVAGGGHVDEEAAATFLESLEISWGIVAGTPDDVLVDSHARCYLLADSQGEHLVTTSHRDQRPRARAACGPVRQLGAQSSQVWDTYLGVVRPTGGKGAGLANPEADATGVALRDVTFWRPDGKEPPRR